MSAYIGTDGHETIRPRSAACVLPAVVLVGAVALVVAAWRLTLTSLVVLAVVAGWWGIVGVMDAMSRVRIDATGLMAVRFYQATTVPWDQVTEVDVEARGRQRRVRVNRHLNQPIGLPLPRSSAFDVDPAFDDKVLRLLSWSQTARPGGIPVGHLRQAPDRRIPAAIAVVVVLTLLLLDQPWHASWWPGRSEATTVPNPCQVIPQELLDRAINPAGEPEAANQDSSGLPGASCRWRGQWNKGDLTWKTAQTLEVSFRLSTREFLDSKSATDLAAVEFDRERRSARPAAGPLTGIGDDAFAVIPDQPSTSAYDAQVRVRRANVSVTVMYQRTILSPEAAKAVLAEVARTAVDAVRPT